MYIICICKVNVALVFMFFRKKESKLFDVGNVINVCKNVLYL